jgi:phage terminase large subunit-like protein
VADVRCRIWNPPGKSQADIFRALPVEERRRRLERLTPRKALALKYEWSFWARPKQLPPPIDVTLPDTPEWRYWLVFAGRMFGKSRLAAEHVRRWIVGGEKQRLVLAGPRYEDVERVQIANLEQAFPPDRRPRYNRDEHKLTFWPYTPGAPYADICSGERPDSFRGPEWDGGWLDEFAAFTRLDAVWDRLIPAMRAIPPGGGPPQLVLTTTPRNRPVLHALLENPAAVLTQGASSENAHNVAGGVLEAVQFVYQGSEFADQELGGKLLGNEPGAMFRLEWFANNRVAPAAVKRLKKKIVIVDTSGSSSSTANEAGIMLLGLSEDGQTAYLLGDFSLAGAGPEDWAKKAAQVYFEHKADALVYESNYGGELVAFLFKIIGARAKLVPYPAVGTKPERAQPVRALMQQGRVQLVGTFPKFEMQATTWTPADPGHKSPDRMDTFVHGVTYLFPAVQVARGVLNIPGFH